MREQDHSEKRSKHRIMKRLIIKDLGPLKEAKVNLGRFNVIIGKQSSGKSTVLRTACYCAWVEKYIELAQSADNFYDNQSAFIDGLVSYHKFSGYIKPSTYIEYETDYMWFAYDNTKKFFDFAWKAKRMDYKRPKISYIPSERNIVSLIPDWKTQVSSYDCLLDYMKDWDIARRYVRKTNDILNLGVRYQFNEFAKEEDIILLPSGQPLALNNSSSGVQSVIPLFVSVDYITRGIYEVEVDKKRTEREREKYMNLLVNLYRLSKFADTKQLPIDLKEPITITVEKEDFLFYNKQAAEAFNDLVKRYSFTQRTDIYLEEPENNLFPPTQCQLMDLLVDLTKRRKKTVSIFATTHSPYVLTHLMQEQIQGLRLFFTHPINDEEGYVIQQATDDEVQEIYDNGLDMFFNYEAFVK